MAYRRALPLVGLLAYGCGSEGPSSPSPSSPMGPTLASSTTQPGVVSGRIVNAVTGEAVPSATVKVGDSPVTTTNADGTFQVETPVSGSFSIVIEAPGYWRRESRAKSLPPPATPLLIDVLPQANDFDLGFYDHVFRSVGAAGTHPWSSEPVFEIWEGVYECTGNFVPGSSCEEMTALDEAAPRGFVDTYRSVIASDSRRYTDGHVVGASVTTRAHPAGTVLTRNQFLERGKVTFAFVSRADNFSWAFWRFSAEGSMTAGHVQLNRRHRDLRGIYSHELAHTLGFDHPLGLEKVPLQSIMRQGHGPEPTRHDLLHGRILYRRPPGSRTPDVDPPGFLLNGLRDDGAGSGPEITRSAP